METPAVAIELADVQAKLGAMMLQIMGYERVILELRAEIAALRASGSAEGPAESPRPVPVDIRRARGELDEETG